MGAVTITWRTIFLAKKYHFLWLTCYCTKLFFSECKFGMMKDTRAQWVALNFAVNTSSVYPQGKIACGAVNIEAPGCRWNNTIDCWIVITPTIGNYIVVPVQMLAVISETFNFVWKISLQIHPPRNSLSSRGRYDIKLICNREGPSAPF